MRHLANLLRDRFPSEFIRISEVFTSDEVYNLEPHYSIRVGINCKEFNSFNDLEIFILTITREK